MELEIKYRIDALKACAKLDPAYAQMIREGIAMEREFELALVDLPDETQDIVWRYLFHCEAMSERLLELAYETK